MATYTANLGFALPAVSDAADIHVLNENFRVIDGKFGGTVITDCNAATKDGWYYCSSGTVNAPEEANSGVLFVETRTGSTGVDVYQTLTSGYLKLHRYYSSWAGKWQDWEWENPPMTLSKAYRTAEKWNGKSVYAQLLDAGYLPNASSKVLNGVIQSGIDELVALECTFSGGWTKKTHDPRIDLTMGVEQPYAWVTITTTADLSAYTGRVLIKWTRPD